MNARTVSPMNPNANLNNSLSGDDGTLLNQWLIAVAQQRDKQAFACLFRWFAPRILRFGQRQFYSEELAHDLVQETLSNVWRKAHLFDVERGQAMTWVFTVMRNQAFDMLRKIKHQREDLLGDDLWPIEQDLPQSDDVFADHLADAHLAEHLSSLPPAQQEVVRGIYFAQLTLEEVAEQLQIPLGTVKSRLRLALAKLRAHLGEHHD